MRLLNHQRKAIFSTMTAGKVLSILCISFLIGCASVKKEQPRVVYVTTPLSLPARPELPKIPSDSLYCVSDETKWALLKRDVAIKNYISELETIINSTKR
jgi:hypothetical protein